MSIVPKQGFSLSHGRKRPRTEAPNHLDFIRSLPCLRCHASGPSEAAHVRFGSIRHGKPLTGKAEKPSDRWTVPLCTKDHREQHSKSELAYWATHKIDPLVIAALLWSASGDEEAGRAIVWNAACFPFSFLK